MHEERGTSDRAPFYCIVNVHCACLYRITEMTRQGSTKTLVIPTTLIAPCGMNCRLCYAYIRGKNHCPGCQGDDAHKSKSCVECRIKNCVNLVNRTVKYCFSCAGYPCARLKRLDKRYRSKYGMSMIDNLEMIKNRGIRHFIRNEMERWTCPECGETLCVHKPQCLSCGQSWR